MPYANGIKNFCGYLHISNLQHVSTAVRGYSNESSEQ
jgi:hypothetical protein